MNQYLAKLFNYETKELIEMSMKWKVVSDSLSDIIDELSQKEVKTLSDIAKLDVYRTFVLQSQFQTNLYFQWSQGIISDGQLYYAEQGLEATQKLISSFKVNFNKMNIDAVRNIIGKSSEGSPLYDLLKASYPDSMDKIFNELIKATAIGQNPRETARNMKQYMDFNGKRALTIARTEQMQVMRETSLMQMKDSGVVAGWQRIEQDDAPDDFCQEENGKIYPLDVPFDSHPNCRGAAIPIVSDEPLNFS
jgi:SPP1 gp7 family putative phage head morphogenesis protein